MDVFQDKNFLEYIQDQKEQEFYDLVQGTMTVVEYEWKFSSLGRYAPHIFYNLRRKLKRFVGRLRSNIRRFIVASDLETFTRVVRIAPLIEEECDRFLEEQKRAGKCPTQQQLGGRD